MVLARSVSPSYHQGLARGDSAFPNSRAGLIWAVAPVLGVTGNRLIDQSGRGHDGILTQMDPSTAWIISGSRRVPGYALKFDGFNDFVVADPIPLASVATTWIMEARLVVDTEAFAILMSYEAGGDFWELRIDGSLELELLFNWSTNGVVSGVTVLDVDRDYHFAVTADSNNLKIYVNGKEDASAATGTYVGVPAIQLGTRFGTSIIQFEGTISDARIYDRAFSPAEIMFDYRNVLSTYARRRSTIRAAPTVSVAVSGTATTGITEDNVTFGGRKIVLTLTGDTWVAAGGTFDAQRQAIIDGITSAQAETLGWNNEVRDTMLVGAVVRTNDTTVTVTLASAQTANYDITATETIEATVPAAALVTSLISVVGTPTFTVTAVGAGALPAGTHALLGVGV